MNDYSIVRSIYKINNIIQSYLNNTLKEFDLTFLDAELLIIINDNGGYNQEQLAYEMNVSKNVIAQRISHLSDLELVLRYTSDSDKRNKAIYLSDKGKDVYYKIITIFTRYTADIIENLGDFNTKSLEMNLRLIEGNAKKVSKRG